MKLKYWFNRWIEIRIIKVHQYNWHTGKSTLVITKYHYDSEDDEFYSTWWKFIPIFGRRI